MNTDLKWSNSSIHDEIRESGLDCVNRPTPETNKLADTLHRDETPLVIRYHKMMMNSQRLERERDEAREKLDRGLKENRDLWSSNAELIEQRDRLADALKPFANYACDEPHIAEPKCHNCVAREALQSLTPKP
jgi:hypothetical protein